MVKLKAGVAGFFEWQKQVYKDPELRAIAAEARKHGGYDIRSLAILIANKGANGRSCFAGCELLAREFGPVPRTVSDLRQQLIELGWFTVKTRRGGATKRALVLDISLPENPLDSHDPWACKIPDCELCQTMQATLSNHAT
jgi:hypothetical protein